jgi:hypothetical protein
MFSVVDSNGQLNKDFLSNIKNLKVNSDAKAILISIMGNQSSGKSLLTYSFLFYVVIFLQNFG